MWFLSASAGLSAAAGPVSDQRFKLGLFILPFHIFPFRLINWWPTNIKTNCNKITFTCCKKVAHSDQQLQIAQLLSWRLVMWDRWGTGSCPGAVHICLSQSWRASISWWAAASGLSQRWDSRSRGSALVPGVSRNADLCDLCASSLWGCYCSSQWKPAVWIQSGLPKKSSWTEQMLKDVIYHVSVVVFSTRASGGTLINTAPWTNLRRGRNDPGEQHQRLSSMSERLKPFIFYFSNLPRCLQLGQRSWQDRTDQEPKFTDPGF